LEFHHIDGNKETQISKLLLYRKEKILNELKKCILLCSNCHVKEHNFIKNKNDYRSKLRAFLYDKSGGRCSCCGENDINALEFHHINPKKKVFMISVGISHRLDINRIVPEINKCTLFCRNCHREHHSGIKKKIK
jgi:hypothetical protein